MSLKFLPNICSSGDSGTYESNVLLPSFFFSGVYYFVICVSCLPLSIYFTYLFTTISSYAFCLTYTGELPLFSVSLSLWDSVLTLRLELPFLSFLFRLDIVCDILIETSGNSSSDESSIFISFYYLAYVRSRPKLPKKLLYLGNISCALMLPSTVCCTSAYQCYAIC